ncbi:hypothetical protein BGZ49_005160 [Haplosporangium sp. Z 27]|nr:hypothetical protein BGZ49_005160 [Haplosporangium sp. Z 27]
MASANPFDLLNDDAQDQEIQVPVVKKDSAKPASKAATKSGAASSASKPAASKPAADNRSPRSNNRPRDSDAPRGPRYDRVPREGGDSTPRPRGSRAPRGARGGRHGGYDRHSGTGKVDSENKENNRLGDPTAAPFEAEKDAELSVEEAAAAATPEPAEPEEVVKTLDDYLQEKAAKALKIALPEARAANAGSDDSKWKNAQILEVEETGDFIKMGKETVSKSRKTKKESKILFTDLDIRYTEPAREPTSRSAFRGGRSGDRGSRGGDRAPRGARGGNNPRPRGAPRSGASVNVDDQELFPSLGSN